MDRPAFKIGQFVSYYAKGSRIRTGPYSVVGLFRHPDGRTLYRIKSRTEEHLANADELRLALVRPNRQASSLPAAPRNALILGM